MKKLFLALCFSVAAVAVSAQAYEGVVFLENQPWSEVTTKAKAEGKLIFVDCYTSWCGPCKALSKETFPTKLCGDFFNPKFVCAKYDMEKGDGLMLHKKYKKYIPGFPTMLILDAQGEVVHTVVGYNEPEALIAAVQAGLDGKTVAIFQRRYQAGERSIDFIKEYAEVLEVAYDKETKERVIRDLVESMPVDSLCNREIYELYKTYLTDINNPRFRFMLRKVDHMGYRVKVNRAELESILEKALSNEVRTVIKTYNTCTNADTLEMMRVKVDSLKSLMSINRIKGIPQLQATLAINDARVAGNIDHLVFLLDANKELQAVNDNYWLSPIMYSYIIATTKDKKLISKYLAEFQLLQSQSNPKQTGIFLTNYYDQIARAYSRLGDQKQAEIAELEYERLHLLQVAGAKEWFPDRTADLDKACAQDFAKQRAAIGMKPIKK